jgi:hypothetical protein
LRTFFERHRELLGEFLSARLSSDLLQHLPRNPRQLEDNLDKVFGDGGRAIFDWFALGHRFQSCCHGGSRK